MTAQDVPELDTGPAPPPERETERVRALSEATLVTRAQDGDVTAFESLVHCYAGELFRLGYRMTGDRADSQDALQDTLVLTWRRLPSLAEPEAFRAWVFQLMTRQCLSLLRRRARRRTMVAEPGPDGVLATGLPVGGALDGPPTPEGAAAESALVHDLRDALAVLPDDLRACWVLKELHEMTYPEIAYAVGVPVSTVRGRIARARARLARGMAGWR